MATKIIPVLDTAKKHFTATMKTQNPNTTEEDIDRRWTDFVNNKESKYMVEMLQDVQQQAIDATLEFMASQVTTFNKLKAPQAHVLNLRNHEQLKVG